MLALAGADFPTEFLQCTKNLGKLRLWKLICTSALVSSTLLLRWIQPEVTLRAFFCALILVLIKTKLYWRAFL
ncbi:MAG: hypothetical protein EB006_12695 [Betaproteobacteria bacterium]|nr:hypothetical protein [Betaproteobacteria bacterium]